MKILLLILCLGILTSTAGARVFNINKESFAPYVVLGGAGSSISAKPFQSETSQDLSYSAGYSALYSGEFGFIYSKSFVNFRFGFEVLKPPDITIDARSSSIQLYSVDSEIMGYTPKIGLEFNLHGDNASRSFISFTYGFSTVTFKNEYSLSTAGQTAFPGIKGHTVETKGSTSPITVSVGYEGFLSDSTTLLAEFGYRMMKINNWTYTKDVTTFQGSFSPGDKWTDTNGSQRETDFSGAFINVGFRIYL